MNIIKFSTELINSKSRFITKNLESEPTHIYRYNLNQFELREIKQECAKFICELSIQDIQDKDSMKDVEFQYAHYLYHGDKLLFLIVTRQTDGQESFLYLLDPFDWKNTLKRFLLNKKLKGQVTNIFISKPLQNKNKDDYNILTIGTLDSALYVIRFTFADVLKKTDDQKLSCGLIRTDARNAIIQEIIVLNQQSKSPANLLLLCGGSNGVIDFFLIKGDSNIDNEPILEYQRHDLVKLPSKLPIVSLQWLTNLNDKQIVLAVGQELFKPMRNSRLIEPSMTILKINIKDLICKDNVATKFTSGTHLNPLHITKNNYKLWACFFDKTEVRITTMEVTADKIGEKINTFLPITQVKDLQQVHIQNENNCWILDKDGYIKLTTTNTHKSRKRRHQSP